MNLKSELGKVLVIMGGESAEREVSLRSGKAVLAALEQSGVDAFGLDFKKDNLNQLLQAQFDVAFIALHGRGGEDGSIQGLLEWMNKPYTGSSVAGSALSMDKWRSKLVWQGLGLPTPNAVVLNKQTNWQQTIEALSYNVIVKPSREGSSIGMQRVTNATELEQSFYAAQKYDLEVIAEQWVTGKEFTVGLVGNEVLPSILLKTSHDFLDYSAKYQSGDTQYILPSGLNQSKEQELGQLAQQAFLSLGLSGWARVDVMQDETGKFWLLEVNSCPGMTNNSLVPMAAKQYGWSFDELIIRILQQVQQKGLNDGS